MYAIRSYYASDTLYSEIQQDLLKPIFVSSLMAHDTFLRDWVLDGEKDPQQMVRDPPGILQLVVGLVSESDAERGCRITSYNVCYTKLLRVPQ